jgi:hypothetical protein
MNDDALRELTILRPHSRLNYHALALQVPYRTDWANYLWTGVWTAVTFTNGVAMGTVFSGKEWDADYRAQMTKVRPWPGTLCCMPEYC